MPQQTESFDSTQRNHSSSTPIWLRPFRFLRAIFRVPRFGMQSVPTTESAAASASAISTVSNPTSSTLQNSSILSWSVFTNPYYLSAVVCGVLAVAVSYYLSYERKPRRDAKRRVIIDDVLRVGDFAILLRPADASFPYILFDTAHELVIALRRATTNQRSQPQNNQQIFDEDEQGLRLINGDMFRTEWEVSASSLRVVERGLHFQKGRALRISLSGRELNLAFQTRYAVEAFLDLLYRAKHPIRPQNLNIFLTTFNVGNAQPPDDLSSWLSTAKDAQIVAIGAQECSYTASVTSPGPFLNENTSYRSSSEIASADKLSSEELTESTSLLESKTSESSASISLKTSNSQSSTNSKEHWHNLLIRHFPEDEFTCIIKQSAWDRCLTIFVRNDLISAVTQVRSDTANTGVGGFAGNKGAIGARFLVFDTEFVIINSHLAAHHKEVNRRNEDYVSITSGLWGLRDDSDVDILASAVHHFFWMGDLNYRINLERDEVLRLIEEKRWDVLQEADQLKQEMAAGRSFHGFSEGKTDFSPTYRYEIGSRKYSAAKLRIPSYCDRILYRSLPGSDIQLKQYQPADEILTSDHSPVFAKLVVSLQHTTGHRGIDAIAPKKAPEEPSQPLIPLRSPRSLSIPAFRTAIVAPKHLQLVFSDLKVADVPAMDHGGRRIAVAKALHIHNHLAWKKHDELGEGQHADPYCTFHGSGVAELDEGEYRTSTRIASQNPEWNADEIPIIDLIGLDKNTVCRRHVVITVKDENPARRDGTIGSVAIWLGHARDGNPIRFKMPVMRGGKQRAEISGEYVIR